MYQILTKGLTRDVVERSSRRIDLNPRTSHHGGNSRSRLKILRIRFKEIKIMQDDSILSNNSFHSHNEDNVPKKGIKH